MAARGQGPEPGLWRLAFIADHLPTFWPTFAYLAGLKYTTSGPGRRAPPWLSVRIRRLRQRFSAVVALMAARGQALAVLAVLALALCFSRGTEARPVELALHSEWGNWVESIGPIG